MSTNPENRLWRTLVRVVWKEPAQFAVVLPAWNVDEEIVLPFQCLKPEVYSQLKEGSRLHAQVNIGAENQDDLIFKDWEYDAQREYLNNEGTDSKT
jgi:hypothetical protein